MFKITITTPQKKTSETIFADYWLAYHSLHSLFGLEDCQIDEAFKISEKEPCLINVERRTFLVEQTEMSPVQIHKEIHLSQSILHTVIAQAEAEDKILVNLTRDFLTRLYNVLFKISKNI